ncbi:hypothetical protein Hanom_Chr06g00509771 [Helianthus anomalus]
MSCSPISYHRPCIRTRPVTILLPCFLRKASGSITTTSTSGPTSINIEGTFIGSHIIDQTRVNKRCDRIM